MTAYPLVSVIIPVFNTERYLGDCLCSVFAQDYRPIEVIVVDDGSTDDSASIAHSFKEAICIRQEHQGASAARNAGIACAHGDMIAFQDADDFWLPNKLTVQVNWLLAHPEIGYLAAHFTNFLEDGVPRPSWIEAHQLNEPQKGGLSTLISRRSVFDKAGLFDPAQKEGADLDWSLRARDAGFAAVAIPDVLMRRRIHGGNLSHQWQGGTALLIKSLKASLDRRRASGNGVGQYT